MVTVFWNGGREATLNGTRWTTVNRNFQDLLDQMTPRVPGYEHDPEGYIAKEIISQLGGKIINRTQPDRLKEGLVY